MKFDAAAIQLVEEPFTLASGVKCPGVRVVYPDVTGKMRVIRAKWPAGGAARVVMRCKIVAAVRAEFERCFP